MPFTFPEDLTMEEYEMYRPARPLKTLDPLGQGGSRPPPGHNHGEEDAITFANSLADSNFRRQFQRNESLVIPA